MFEHYFSILLSYFRETAIGNASNYKPGKGQEKQENKTEREQRTENRYTCTQGTQRWENFLKVNMTDRNRS